MRYLVKARVKPGSESALLRSIADGTLGRASIAGDEYRHDMQQARISAKGEACWLETCFCDTPLEEERPYWEKYFSCLRSKTPTRAGTAVTKTAVNRGRAAIVIARSGWKRNWRGAVNAFWKN